MWVNLNKIFGLAMLATSIVGDAGGTTLKYGGLAVEYGSWGVRNTVDAVLYTTENIGYYAKETGKFVEQESKDLNDYATNVLRKEEYRDLTTTYDFKERVVENGWTLIN